MEMVTMKVEDASLAIAKIVRPKVLAYLNGGYLYYFGTKG
jgi:hypothetical protein